MGVNQKYCKVTVHKAPQPSTSNCRMRRQTIAFEKQSTNTQNPLVGLADYSFRRRATTVTSKGRGLNPLSRMTMRYQRNDLQDEDEEDDDPPMLPASVEVIDGCAMLSDSFLDVDTDAADPERKTFAEEDNHTFFDVGTPPIPNGMTVDMLPNEFYTPPVPAHIRSTSTGSKENDSEYDPQYDPNDDDDASSGVMTSSFVDLEDDHEVDLKIGRRGLFPQQVDENERAPRFLNRGRENRGLSSPPRMLTQAALARNQSVLYHSARRYSPITMDGADAEDQYANQPNALRHGQPLHLAFKTSTGQTIQVSSRQMRSSAKHMFSKRIRCVELNDDSILSNVDSLRIIGHTSDSEIRGGDRISLARRDGHVLRIQTMSRKLCFSPKIDAKAKFIVCGVPEGTIVTETTKFYLQSVYDRSKTVGFLKSKRSQGTGCLVMYAYRNKDDKSEPIQFFKRLEVYGTRLHPNHNNNLTVHGEVDVQF